MNQWKDRLGIIASVTCAVHCAATPVLLAFLPALTFTEWMASPRFHQVAAIVCVSIVSFAIWPAFRKYRDYGVLSLSTVGLGLVVAAAFALPDGCCTHTIAMDSEGAPAGRDLSSHSNSSIEFVSTAHEHTAFASVVNPELAALVQPWMTPLGGVLLVIAHGLNLRRRVCPKNRCDCRTESREAPALLLVNSKAA